MSFHDTEDLIADSEKQWHLFDDVPLGETMDSDDQEQVVSPGKPSNHPFEQDASTPSPDKSPASSQSIFRTSTFSTGDNPRDPFETLTIREKIRLQALQMNIVPRKIGSDLDSSGQVELTVQKSSLVSDSTTKLMFSKFFNKTSKVDHDGQPIGQRTSWSEYRDKMRKEISAGKRKIWEEFRRPYICNEDEEIEGEVNENASHESDEFDSVDDDDERDEIANFEDLEREDAVVEEKDDIESASHSSDEVDSVKDDDERDEIVNFKDLESEDSADEDEEIEEDIIENASHASDEVDSVGDEQDEIMNFVDQECEDAAEEDEELI